MQSVSLKLRDASVNLDANNPRIYIGRDAHVCALATNDPSVSRRHAEVFLHGDYTYIRDLGSSNGTWVDGAPVGADAVALRAGQHVFVGHAPLGVEWHGVDAGATVMAVGVPDELRRLMEAHKAKLAAQTAPVAPAQQVPAPSAQYPAQQGAGAPAGVAGGAPNPAQYVYRRQGENSNGVLLVALRGDTFNNEHVIDGYLEFTATDNETVASITVDLVECHKKGPRGGHVWDRMLVRQGPWKTKRGDVLPMPFQLRVPSGTSISGPSVQWEIRGYVDINWASDIEAKMPINMRNLDIEKLRDALGALDYRIGDMHPEPLGQRFIGEFFPPAQLRAQIGISKIDLRVEYLGANLKVNMKLDKRLRSDPQRECVFELAGFRNAPVAELSGYFQQLIHQMMS